MSCHTPLPIMTHFPGSTLARRAAIQSACPRPSESATSTSDSLSLATAAADMAAATHSQTHAPDALGSPPRPIRHIVCPSAPKKRLPTQTYSTYTATAISNRQLFVNPAASFWQESHEDRQAGHMSQLTSKAQPIRSVQGLLGRSNQLSAAATVDSGVCTNVTTTQAAVGSMFADPLDSAGGADNGCESQDASLGDSAMSRLPQQADFGLRQGLTSRPVASCSPEKGPQLKRIKSDRRFDAVSAAEDSSFSTAAWGCRLSAHEVLKAVQLDRVPIETDVSFDLVLKRAGAGSQSTPLQPPVNGHVAYDKLSGNLSISRAVPEAMFGFTQGSVSASTQNWNRGHNSRRQHCAKPCMLPSRVFEDGSAAGLLDGIAALTPANPFFPGNRQQLFVSSFNLPPGPSPPSTLRPFFNLPQL